MTVGHFQDSSEFAARGSSRSVSRAETMLCAVRWARDIPGWFVFEATVLKIALQPRRQDARSLMSVRSPTWMLTLGWEERDGCIERSREAERA
jgi:hypothetical protein